MKVPLIADSPRHSKRFAACVCLSLAVAGCAATGPVSSSALVSAPQQAPLHYCTAWVIREIVTTSADCETAVMKNGLPTYFEGLARRGCRAVGNVDGFDNSTSPPTPHCKTQPQPDPQ